jgi:hypothetical protein
MALHRVEVSIGVAFRYVGVRNPGLRRLDGLPMNRFTICTVPIRFRRIEQSRSDVARVELVVWNGVKTAFTCAFSSAKRNKRQLSKSHLPWLFWETKQENGVSTD